MITGPPRITRRALLQAAVLAALSAIVAACARVVSPSPAPTAAPPTASTGPLPSGSAAPAPSPTPSSAALRRKIARLLVVGFRGLTVDEEPWVRTAIAQEGLGGVILSDGDVIQARHLSLSFVGAAAEVPPDPWDQFDFSGSLHTVMKRAVAEVERRKIERTLRDASQDKAKAAEMLGLTYKSFVTRLKELRID